MTDSSMVIATYVLKSKDIKKAAQALAIGQSIGHPTLRTRWDKKVSERHLAHAKIKGHEVTVSWPSRNFGTKPSLNHMMSVLMGGQMDIDLIKGCRLIDLDLTSLEHLFPKPHYGMGGIRRLVKKDKGPLLGAVLKPKQGLKPNEMAEICLEMAQAGIDFIKEDECLATEAYECSLEVRVPIIMKSLSGTNTLYTPCITSDHYEDAYMARLKGAKAVHLNLWAGLGTYHRLRTSLDLALFFQKSGDKVWTTGPFSIDYAVLCKLIWLAGCDIAHIGMYGGYMSESVEVLKKRIKAMGTTLPSFSCGMTPKAARKIVDIFGPDVMLTSGGWIGSHPKGITYAVKEMQRAIS